MGKVVKKLATLLKGQLHARDFRGRDTDLSDSGMCQGLHPLQSVELDQRECQTSLILSDTLALSQCLDSTGGPDNGEHPHPATVEPTSGLCNILAPYAGDQEHVQNTLRNSYSPLPRVHWSPGGAEHNVEQPPDCSNLHCGGGGREASEHGERKDGFKPPRSSVPQVQEWSRPRQRKLTPPPPIKINGE